MSDRRGVESWLMRSLGWPLVLLLALTALTAIIAREAAAAGPGVGGDARVPARGVPGLRAAAGTLAAPPIALHVVGGLGPAPAIQAASAFVFDGDTGGIYYAGHADDERAMASTTKIMTALVAVQRLPLDRRITAGADAAALVNPDNSYMGLALGEQLTLEELLYGLLLPSGNDAAVAIADGVAGSQPAFVALMNQEAQALQLAHTHFADPHGLDAPGHYTSARDLATLAAVALRDPTIARIAATPHEDIAATATHKAYHLDNYNSLLPGKLAPYPGAIGLKPGNTGDAGWCEAFAARRDGHLIIGVVLGDPSWSQRNVDMHTLLDWGFKQDGVPAAG